ncbi:MAG: undecaprenyldiphospho-muramoylpentapeptide beta-N-acetylglucosaminyltransferase [Firmicutes bacterium]|nr:undecaprenyldiphospho-muramoylpentapeptide beta-N-acetylglucosaminyltransferase [Bacillota bacterium]
MQCIVLTGGGTGGHVVPNIALLPELKKHFKRIVYIGSINGIERKLLKAFPEVEFYSIETVKLVRKFALKNLLIPFKLIRGKAQAKEILRRVRPSVVFSKGGFVSVPVVLAAGSLNIPVVSHESDLTLGLANKLTKNKSKIICTSFKETADKLKNGVYTGTPIRKEILDSNKDESSKLFGLATDKPVVLIVGGSSGANKINQTIRKTLAELTKNYQVLHSCGKGNIDTTIKDKNYVQIEYIQDMGAALACAEVVVTRGGSNTIFEILACRKPMLIIPLPKGASRGDQVENAAVFKQNGWAEVLAQDELTPESLLTQIDHLYKNRDTIKNRLASANLPNGVNNIIEQILKGL